MKKSYRIAATVAIALVFLTLILSFFAGNLVETEVRAYLRKHPPKGFKVEFDDISVRLWSRMIKIKGINIISSTDSFSLHKPGLEPESIKIKSIELSGVRIIKALKGEDFKISKIEILDPKLSVLTEGSIFNAKKSIEKSKETRSDTAQHKLFKSLEIGKFVLENGEVSVLDSINGNELLKSASLDLSLKNISIDSSLSLLGASAIDINIHETKVILPGDLYQLQFNLMQIAKDDSLIFFDNAKLVPLYPQYEFARVVGKQTDRFSIEIPRMGVRGIDFDTLLIGQRPIIRLIEIDSMHVSIFRDKNMPFDFSNYPKLPHEALRTMKKPMMIKEVKISNGFAEYIEHEEGAEKPGMVYFERINGNILNITSDSIMIGLNPIMEVKANMMLYGKGEMYASINMPLNDQDDKFTFLAEVGNFEVSEANRMITPGSMVDVSEGTIDKLTLSGTGNRYLGKGSMTMLYHDLQVELLRENKEGNLKRKWFLSTVANEIVKSANPLRTQPARVVPMYFERDMNKGVINFLWKTCFSGIKETLKPTKQKEGPSRSEGRKN
jgi:hypothetical protein